MTQPIGVRQTQLDASVAEILGTKASLVSRITELFVAAMGDQLLQGNAVYLDKLGRISVAACVRKTSLPVYGPKNGKAKNGITVLEEHTRYYVTFRKSVLFRRALQARFGKPKSQELFSWINTQLTKPPRTSKKKPQKDARSVARRRSGTATS